MMGATGAFEDTGAMTPEEAAGYIIDGIADRKQHIGRGTDLRRARAQSTRGHRPWRASSTFFIASIPTTRMRTRSSLSTARSSSSS